jgi:hypothetical protein
MSEQVPRLAPGRPHSSTARHCADRSAPLCRMQPPFLSPTGVEKGHGPCFPHTAATMDVRVTTATHLSSAHGCKRPLLLVHGFLATRRVVASLASRLGRLGYCPHGVDLGGLFGRFNTRPVEELAASWPTASNSSLANTGGSVSISWGTRRAD